MDNITDQEFDVLIGLCNEIMQKQGIKVKKADKDAFMKGVQVGLAVAIKILNLNRDEEEEN